MMLHREDNLIEFYCFTCRKFFFVNGNDEASKTCCEFCKGKNIDDNATGMYNYLKNYKTPKLKIK